MLLRCAIYRTVIINLYFGEHYMYVVAAVVWNGTDSVETTGFI